MMTLSLQPTDRLAFPDFDITVQVLSPHSPGVRMGVTAPAHVRVERVEAGPPPGEPPPPSLDALTHSLCNRLNKVVLGLNLCQRQWDAGLVAEAKMTLDRARATLETMDRDWLVGLVAAAGS